MLHMQHEHGQHSEQQRVLLVCSLTTSQSGQQPQAGRDMQGLCRLQGELASLAWQTQHGFGWHCVHHSETH